MTVITTTVATEDDKEVAAKVYKSRIPGCTFILPSGEVLSFDYKGECSTTSGLAQRELDKVCDKPGNPIFTDHYVPTKQENQPVTEIQNKAAQVVADMKAQQAAATK